MNKKTEQIMIVGEVNEVLSKMSAYLDYDVQIQLPERQLKKWIHLEEAYKDFYKLPLQERLYASGMAAPPQKVKGKK